MKKLNWKNGWYFGYRCVEEQHSCKIKNIKIDIATIFRSADKFNLKSKLWKIKINGIYFDHKKFQKRYQAKRFTNQVIRLIFQLFPNYDFNWQIPQDRELSLNEIVNNYFYIKNYSCNYKQYEINKNLSKELFDLNIRQLRKLLK